MKTFVPRPSEHNRKWYLIDASGKILGRLASEIAKKISSELREINFIYGLDSNIYWELVRKNTIKYWLDMDRHEIFEIEEIL